MKKVYSYLLAASVVTGISLTVQAGYNMTEGYGDNLSDTVFVEHFNDATGYGSFKIIDSNSDGNTWRYESDNQCATCYGVSQQSNDWLITPEIDLAKDKVYELSFRTFGSGSSYTEQIEVKYGQGESPDAYTTFMPATNIDFTGGVFTNTILISSEGKYRIGFHAISKANQYALNVDDIVLREVADANAPAKVRLLTATADAEGKNEVTLSFYAPSLRANGSPLSGLTKIEIIRDGKVVGTIDSPKSGAKQSFTDTDMPTGENAYTVIAYNEDGKGIPAYTTVYAGEDKPGAVTSVKLSNQDGKLVLTWKAPENGATGKYFNPDHVKYNVYYANKYSVGDLYQGNISGTSCVVDGDNGEQRIAGFYVSAVNDAGEGEKTESNKTLMGSPYQLPVIQDFSDDFMSDWTKDDWTDSEGHLWWRETPGTTGASYSTNEYVVFRMDGYDDAYFNTGKLNLKSTTTPTLTFRYNMEKSAIFKVEAVTPDQTTIQLDQVSTDTQTETGWNSRQVDLSSLKSYDFVIIKFHGTSDEEAYPYLDDIKCYDAVDYNLSAKLIAPQHAVAGLPYEANVIVSNLGTKELDGYQIKLFMNGSVVNDTTITESIASLGIDTVAVQFTPQVGVDTCEVYAVVSNDNDMNADDNQTKTVSLTIEQPVLTTVNDLKAVVENGVTELSWTPITPNEQTVTDDFESYPAFTLPGDGHYLEFEYNIGPWYCYDADKEYSLDVPDYKFPWEEEAFSFITFNGHKLQTDSATEDSGYATCPEIFEAHSGEQFLAAFTMKSDMAMGNEVSDWLISPQLSGDAQTISFWVQTLLPTYNGTACFDVAYSTTDANPSSFSHVLLSEVVNRDDATTWTEYTVNLPDGAKFFAIHHTTPLNINQILMIDDATYTTGTGKPLEYRVYRDGQYIGSTDKATFTDNESGEHVYRVSVVYNCGESPLSNEASSATGINGITTNDNPVKAVYDINGVRTDRLHRGLNIVKFKDGSVKKIIVK